MYYLYYRSFSYKWSRKHCGSTFCILFSLLFISISTVNAQSLLEKPISIEAKNKPVKHVFSIMEQQHKFSFSYNSSIIHDDSLVNVSTKNKTIKQTLQLMFGDRFQYKSVDDHIIILPAEKEKWYTISGYVLDAVTREPIVDVSVFERQQLASALTSTDGSFKLRIKDKGKYNLAEITFSKGGFYTDTSINTQPGFDEQLSVMLVPTNHNLPDVLVTPYASVERSWFGKYLFSSKLRKQSANLGKFFVDKPVQVSFVPGLGSHGKLSGQVTNKFSFNILGGYAAGVDGFELGGLFNIDKKDVRYAQVGGLFNIVSGDVEGVQVAGIVNKINKSVSGVQVSGIAGIVGGDVNGVAISGICNRGGEKMKGVQIAGVANILDHKDSSAHVTDTVYSMKGMQLAGVANVVNSNSVGFQLAGVANVCRGNMKGLQMSGIVNITKKLEGSQIGLVNIADTVTGYSIGLINIVKHGYHALCISTNELTTVNIAYKTGTKHLYSILTVGINNATDKKVTIYGTGIGSERAISKKTALSGELSVLNIYEDRYNANALLIKAEPTFNWNITRKFTLYAGPSVCFSPYRFRTLIAGSQYDVPSVAIYNFKTGGNTAIWIGWQVGFHIF